MSFLLTIIFDYESAQAFSPFKFSYIFMPNINLDRNGISTNTAFRMLKAAVQSQVNVGQISQEGSIKMPNGRTYIVYAHGARVGLKRTDVDLTCWEVLKQKFADFFEFSQK
jgi:hypothetical protein